jgi:hypothetical protein
MLEALLRRWLDGDLEPATKAESALVEEIFRMAIARRQLELSQRA